MNKVFKPPRDAFSRGGTEAAAPHTALPHLARVPVVDPLLLHNLAVRALGLDGQAAIAVASVLHGDGATTIASSLAACVAASLGQRVVIVDANLRRPALRQVFGLKPGPGWGEVVSGEADLESALQLPAAGPAGAGRMLVLPASLQDGATPSPWLGTGITKLIDALYGYAELLMFDGAPLQDYPDTTLLSRHLNGVVVVLRAEHTTWDQGTQAVQDLRNGGGQILGAVLNRGVSHLPRLFDRLF